MAAAKNKSCPLRFFCPFSSIPAFVPCFKPLRNLWLSHWTLFLVAISAAFCYDSPVQQAPDSLFSEVSLHGFSRPFI